MSTKVDITMHAGERKEIDITFTDEGAPVDVSTAAVTFVVAHAPGNPALVTKTIGTGITVINGPAGVVRVVLEPADTADRFGRFYHECRVTESGPVPWVGTYGVLTVRPSSTA